VGASHTTNMGSNLTHIFFSFVKTIAIKFYIHLIFCYIMGVVILLLITMLIPIPAPLKANSRVQDLKKRLDWGEPALTIIDVRNRDAFNISHITGAVSIPLNQLVEQVLLNLELVRDIYVYSSSDEETATAAVLLKEAGYQNVAQLLGGLAAWKAAGYPFEGNAAIVA